MQSPESVKVAPGARPGGLSALLDWWRLAGADIGLSTTPTSWFEAASADGVAAPAAPLLAPARATAANDPYAGIPSLAALRAAVEAEVPGAPFADGNPESGLMLFGEAPSVEDLRSGRPFSGPAGDFLDRMLAAIGLDRTRCYISLICPRRRLAGPPPESAITADLPLTRAHVRLAAPKLLLLMGGVPVKALAGETAPITSLQGRWLSVDCGAGPVPALATVNPAYLLRKPEAKAAAWRDLLALKRRLAA